MQASRIAPLIALVLVAGCSGAAGPDASEPPPSQRPSAAPAADFTVEVFPADEPSAVRMAIPGSGYCFLVRVTETGEASGDPVTIDATATSAAVAKIVPSQLAPGVVGEVWVIADPATTEVTGSVTITATRDALTREVTRTLPVFPMADERAADAQPHFDAWIAWLATARPELGITAATTWEPVFVSTLLVVSHYSYWSEDWEVTIAWHNMIPPDDWSDVFLRRRGEETGYSLAFRQDSMVGQTEPREIEPPVELVR
jgi:hypothetical protein